ncbi:MAG: hypothetical protein IT494_08215, partial [Gammaproteobacteria bacterium]|nr:hypothetical protein [Gammaproteobacteria bacterium]
MRPGHRAAILVLVAMFALTLNVAAQSNATAALVASLRAQVEALAAAPREVSNRHRLLSSIYAARAYLPIWTAPDRVAQLQRAIAASEREG